MNPLTSVCFFMVMFRLALAGTGSRPQTYMQAHRNTINNSLRPTNWLPSYEMESLPSFDEMTFERLEHMPVQEGADVLNKLYHLAQINADFEPSFTPKASEIQVYMYTPNKHKMSFKLNELTKMVMEAKYFGDQVVTMFITGLPQESETINKATRKLVEAYMQRYSDKAARQPYYNYKHEESVETRYPSSSEENYATSKRNQYDGPSGSFVIVDLGSAFSTFKDYATLDIEETGAMIGDILVQLTDNADVAQETVHVIGSNIAAHVAGAAGRQYTRKTGHQLRRITGLDPSKIYARTRYSLTALARGDAEFVDAIHTSAYGMGTATRYADVDFYPNGPGAGVPGADNVIEASMRAVRYYAESVMPGNERSFPAAAAISLKEYTTQKGHGKRVYMGIYTDYNVEGDFVLLVNNKSPFGRMTPAQKQQNYYSIHKPGNMW